MLHSIRYIVLALMLCSAFNVEAQNSKERGEVRRGYKAFVKDDFEAAAEHFNRAVEYAPESFEARYNLGSALLKGEKGEDAEKLLADLAADSLQSDHDRAETYFNLGNSQFAQQKLEEALESYKSSMRLDPDDQEAKYNYAYTKALLEQQQQDQQDQQDQNEDQQDQEQNQDQNEDQQDQEQNQDQQNQDQQEEKQDDEQEGEQEQDQQQPQPQEGEISEQEQQQMLDAIQAQEDKTQEDLKERARGAVVPSAKSW